MSLVSFGAAQVGEAVQSVVAWLGMDIEDRRWWFSTLQVLRERLDSYSVNENGKKNTNCANNNEEFALEYLRYANSLANGTGASSSCG